MDFSKVFSAFGLRSLPTTSPTAEDVDSSADDFVHITETEYTEPTTQESSDELLVMIVEDTPADRIAAARAAIACCAQVCLGLLPTGSGHGFPFLREGFGTLLDCASVLQPSNGVDTCIVVKHKLLLHNLYNIWPYNKKTLCKVITLLLEGVNSENDDFEVPPFVWVFRLGPLPLADGFSDGKEICEILLKAEDQWMEEYVDKRNYDKMKAALREFAAALSAWVEYVNGMTAGCEAKKKSGM